MEHGAPSDWDVGQSLGGRLWRSPTITVYPAAAMRLVRFASRPAKHGTSNGLSIASALPLGRSYAPTHAGALTEVLIVISTVCILAALLLPRIAAGRAQANRIDCIANLKWVGLGARMWSNDHDKSFPWQVSTNDRGALEFASAGAVERLILPLSRKISGPRILSCPSDELRSPATSFATLASSNLSYFIGLDALDDDPRMILSGDRNLSGGQQISERLMLVAPDAALNWGAEMHVRAGNICLADGSVQQANDKDLQNQVKRQTNSVRFALP